MAIKTPADGATVLKFSGPATIRQVQDAWSRLAEAAGTHPRIDLDLAEVTATDLIFLQLVESARRTWAAAGGDVRLTSPANAVVRDILERGGLLDPDDTSRLQFWTHTGAAQ